MDFFSPSQNGFPGYHTTFPPLGEKEKFLDKNLKDRPILTRDCRIGLNVPIFNLPFVKCNF